MRLSTFVLAACLLMAGLAPGARAQDAAAPPSLKVGDDAPPLAVSKFVRGEPVERFEAGKVYVVEFWATWSEPSHLSIPHLTELQEQYEDQGVVVIGVDAYEPDPSEVADFVEELGDEMNYRVALDDVPADGEPQDGKMARTWMDAAGQEGIPTAFIVDRKGKIAWIGHPLTMDETLAKVVAGEFDPVAARKKEELLAALVAKLQLADGPEDIKKVLPQFEELMGDTEQGRAQFALLKFNLLLAAGDGEGAAEAGQTLLEGELGQNPDMMNNLAWTVVDPARPTEPGEAELAFARKAAERAVALTDGQNWMILDTLARVRFVEGDAKAALELQEKAVDLAGDELEDQPDVKERLEDYRKAAGAEDQDKDKGEDGAPR